MDASSEQPKFKFKFVKNGQPRSLFAKQGHTTEQGLVLGQTTIPYTDITDTTTRDSRLILTLGPRASVGPDLAKELTDTHYLVLEISKLPARQLEQHIDRQASALAIAHKRQQLQAQGRGDTLRVATCPHCRAAIDLTDLTRTPMIYCRFCETLFRDGGEIVAHGDTHRHCDECQMFDRVQGYTEFYFYFLLIVYGYSYKRRYVCDTCANRIFWKMLLLNFIFVLGIPPALYLKYKSIRGRDASLKDLAKANALARKGQYREADPIYHQLTRQNAMHPGIAMNEGLGHLLGQDGAGAMAAFERSLQGCSNYLPTLRLLHQLQTHASQQS